MIYTDEERDRPQITQISTDYFERKKLRERSTTDFHRFPQIVFERKKLRKRSTTDSTD